MPTIWIDSDFNFDVASGAQVVTSLMTGVSSTQSRFDRMTLMRTIIGLDLAYTVHDSGEGSQQLALGIAMTSQESFAAGTVPEPTIATEYPARGWIWKAFYRVYGFAADQPAVYNARVDMDLRGRRKLENGEAYLVVNNTVIEGVASATRIHGLIRQLWLVG